MKQSVFAAVPNLEGAIGSGTRQNVRVEENRCKPGDVHKYSGAYETMLGEIRIDLFRIDSPIDKVTAVKLLREARNYFHKNSH